MSAISKKVSAEVVSFDARDAVESLQSYIASDIYGGARAGALGIPPSLMLSKFFFARIDVPQREIDEVLGEFPVQRMMGTYPAKGSKFESGANQIQQHAWRHLSSLH